MALRRAATTGQREPGTSASRALRRATDVLLVVAVGLTALSLGLPNVTDWPVLAAPDSPVRGLVDVAAEQNLPTWFAVTVLAVAAVAHLVAAGTARSVRLPVWRLWLVSAAILAALSLDDASSLHERLDGLGRDAGAGDFPFAWVIPGAVLGLVVVAAVVLLAVRVERPVRRLLVGGLVLVIGAALVVETINGAILAAQGPSQWYVLMTHLEELAEMAGAVLLLRAGLTALDLTSTPDGGVLVRYGTRQDGAPRS